MILVVGGTGRVGRKVVELLSADREVRVLTRDPAKARDLTGLSPAQATGAPAGQTHTGGVEMARGDLRDRASVERALRRVTTVVCTAQGGERSRGPEEVEGTGIPQLIELATEVRQFVYVSTASASKDSPVAFFRLKYAVEEKLRESGVPHSILRPTHLLDTWTAMLSEPLRKKGKAMVLGSGDNKVSWVAGDDIARAAARLTLEDGAAKRYDLGGPDALTLNELNALIAEAIGVTIRGRNQLHAGMLRFLSAVTRPFNALAARQMAMGALLDTRPQTTDSAAAWRQFGITPLSARQWMSTRMP